jgi:hypothetical protein
VATQKDAARGLSSHGDNCSSEPLLVTFRTAAVWWTVGSQLAEWEIAAEDSQPGGAERSCKRHEKRRVAVCSRTVREDEAIPSRIGRGVQEATNWYCIFWSVRKFSIVHSHGHCRQWLQPFPRYRLLPEWGVAVGESMTCATGFPEADVTPTWCGNKYLKGGTGAVSFPLTE